MLFSARISRSPNQTLPATNPRQPSPLQDRSCLNANSAVSDSETHFPHCQQLFGRDVATPTTTPAASASLPRPSELALQASHSKNSLARESGSAASSKSLKKAIRILLHLGENGPLLSLTGFASAVRLNKTTVHGLLGALQKFPLVERNPHSDKYCLGLKFHALGALSFFGGAGATTRVPFSWSPRAAPTKPPSSPGSQNPKSSLPSDAGACTTAPPLPATTLATSATFLNGTAVGATRRKRIAFPCCSRSLSRRPRRSFHRSLRTYG
jgi:hypothetical protein